MLYYVFHVSCVLLLVAEGPFTSYTFALTLATSYPIILKFGVAVVMLAEISESSVMTNNSLQHCL